jgi:hypothetical protein
LTPNGQCTDILRRCYSTEVAFWPDQPELRSRIAYFPATGTRGVPHNTFMCVGWEKGLADDIGELPATRQPRGNLPESETGDVPYSGADFEWLGGAAGFQTLDTDTNLPAGVPARKRGRVTEVWEADSLIEWLP